MNTKGTVVSSSSSIQQTQAHVSTSGAHVKTIGGQVINSKRAKCQVNDCHSTRCPMLIPQRHTPYDPVVCAAKGSRSGFA